MSEHTDVLIIGAGSAGTAAAKALARGGRRVVVAEPDRVGGTCLWRGCIPKKALFHAAAVARNVRRAEEFGVLAGPESIDWPTVLAWKWHAQETYAGDQNGILSSLGIERIVAAARLTGPNSAVVGDREFSADDIIISTGAVPVELSLPGAELAEYSDAALRYQTLPDSLCIIGAGYIAFEFAGIYASFGTRVTLLSRSEHMLKEFDPDCVAIARTALEGLGVEFVTNAHVTGISGEPGHLTVAYEGDGQAHALAVERVLAATGRRPAYDGLDLEVAGVTFDDRGRVILDDALRSVNPHVYFAGDAAAREQHTPVANEHGHTVARSILSGVPVAPDTFGAPFACFTVPELAQTGMTEAAAAAAGIEVDVQSTTLEYIGAAIIADARHGLVKILAEKNTHVIVGAHIAADRASDLIYALTLAVRARHTLEDVQRTLAIHPAFSESVNWAAF